MTQEEKRNAELQKGLHSFFKLQTTMSTSSMVLFDQHGCIKKYDDVRQILQEFFELRLEFYGKRKRHLEGMLGAEALKLSNQARFIIEKCDGSLVVENKKRKKMVEEIVKRNYDPDPVKKWKSAQAQAVEDFQDDQRQSQQSDSDIDAYRNEEAKAEDFDYLLSMTMWNLTLEKKEDLLRKKQEKQQELEKLRATSKEYLWREDLTEFLKKLDEFEQKQLANQQVANKKGQKKDGARKKTNELSSPIKGIRIAPHISGQLMKKISAAKELKDKKNEKDAFIKNWKEKMAESEPDEFDDMGEDKEHNRSLSDRLGFSLKAEEKPKKTKVKRESSEKTKNSKGKKAQGKNPWDGDEASPSDSDLSNSSFSDSEATQVHLKKV
jgi:DNA topoisomerase-2